MEGVTLPPSPLPPIMPAYVSSPKTRVNTTTKVALKSSSLCPKDSSPIFEDSNSDNNGPTTSPDGNGVPTNAMTVSEYLEAKFSSFDRIYGSCYSKQSSMADSTIDDDDDDDDDDTVNCSNLRKGHRRNGSRGKVGSKSDSSNNDASDGNDDNDDDKDEDAQATLTYFALLTSLYLPLLLFLYVSQSEAGASSLLRSLLFGHLVRLFLALLLLPPSVTQGLLPPRVWNAGVRLRDIVLRVGGDMMTAAGGTSLRSLLPGWTAVVVGVLLGVEDPDGDHSSHSGKVGSGFGSHASVLGIRFGIVGAGGGSGGGSSGDVWPPPALTGLAVFTVIAFIVHPDGLTWIFLGRLWNAIRTLFQKILQAIRMIKYGNFSVSPATASGSLVSVILLLMILRQIFFSSKSKYKSANDDANDVATTVTQGRRNRGFNRKKGKKGRGGRHHHHTSGGGSNRARIRSSDGWLGHRPMSKEPQCDSSQSSPCKQITVDAPPRSLSPTPLLVSEESTGTDTKDRKIRERERLNSSDSVGTTLSIASTRNDGALSTEKDGISQLANKRISDVRKKHTGLEPRQRTAEDEKSCSSLPITLQSDSQDIMGFRRKEVHRLNRGRMGKRRGKGKRQQTNIDCSNSDISSVPLLRKSSRITDDTIANQSLITRSLSSVKSMKKNLHANSFIPNTKATSSKNQESSGRLNSSIPLSEYSRDTSSSPLILSSGDRESNMVTNLDHSSVVPIASKIDINLSLSNAPVSSTNYACSRISDDSHPSASEFSLASNSVSISRPPMLSKLVGGSESLFSEPLNTNSLGCVRYPVPIGSRSSLKSFGGCDRRYSSGKIELASFLAQVGLVGTACADLLADLADVDTMGLLTDAELESYGIGSIKRNEIQKFLCARRVRHSLENCPLAWAGGGVNPLPPPPGLGLSCNKSIGGVRSKTTLPESSMAIHNLPCRRQNVSFSFNNSPNNHDNVISDAATLLYASTSQYYGEQKVNKEQSDFRTSSDEEIEASLEKLGGQMAGSILDF